MTWKQKWMRIWRAVGAELETWNQEDRDEFERICRLLAQDAAHPADRRRLENYADVAQRVSRGEDPVAA